MVGSSLAGKLAGDCHDVVVVELSRELVAELGERLDVQVVQGNGSTVATLVKAGIEGCDLLFATTNSDEANMVVALIGSALFRVPRVVARLRDPEHEEALGRIAAAVGGSRLAIDPESAAVERILAMLPVPGAVDVAPFFDRRLLVAGFVVSPDSDFKGLLLSHFRLLFPTTPVLVVAIRREGRWIIPSGEDEILAHDLVYLALGTGEVDNVLSLLHLRRGKDRCVIVAGATRIGLKPAHRLERAGIPVTLLDARQAACEAAAVSLDSTLVVRGSPTDRELLEDEGAEAVDGFVACTDDHEENMVACLLARRLGAAHTFAVVDNAALAGLIGDVGIDSIISPRLLAVSLAMQLARKGRVTAVAALMDDTVEVLEVEAVADSRLVRRPLAGLGLPRGILVAALKRRDEIMVPGGADQIQPGDSVLFITTSDRTARLDPFLGG